MHALSTDRVDSVCLPTWLNQSRFGGRWFGAVQMVNMERSRSLLPLKLWHRRIETSIHFGLFRTDVQCQRSSPTTGQIGLLRMIDVVSTVLVWGKQTSRSAEFDVDRFLAVSSLSSGFTCWWLEFFGSVWIQWGTRLRWPRDTLCSSYHRWMNH